MNTTLLLKANLEKMYEIPRRETKYTCLAKKRKPNRE